MPHEKIKSDNYSNFGGINQKASVYLTGQNEALDIFNFTGEIVGDLTGRPGSTQYFSATFANTGILGLSEYTKLSGYSKIMVANPGGMWLGQDNSVTGISIGNLGSTQSTTFLLAAGGGPGGTQYFSQTIPAASFGPNKWDFETFVDHQFFCDGRSFLKFNGTTQTFWSLPDAIFNVTSVGVTSSGAGSSNGGFLFAFAWVNERGFIGAPRVHFSAPSVSSTINNVYVNITFPIQGFGITALAIYTYFSPTIITDLGLLAGRPDERFRLYTLMPTGSTVFGPVVNPYSSSGDIPNVYVPFGQTSKILSGTTSYVMEFLEVPRFTELFHGMLFWSGTSQNPSSCYFSDPDLPEPESWNPEWELEFRTNDGDKVTALKTYGNRLMVGKELSLHELTGYDAESFVNREISTEYGILNNRACTTWEGRFWFLDRRGIGEYTGSLPKIISDKIEYIFLRMNLSAARDQAQMIYMKNRDEVWTLIPIDSSSVNNLLIVYDIKGDGWYFWDGPNVSVLAKMIGRFGKETSFYGDYSGRVNAFGASFFGDNGSGFTSLVKFRYESPDGKSVEKMFRRLFVNADSMAGNATLSLQTRMRADYGSSYQVNASMVLSSFQQVQNFGVAAKSLSVEISHFSAVDSIRLHGYALEHRWLRNT